MEFDNLLTGLAALLLLVFGGLMWILSWRRLGLAERIVLRALPAHTALLQQVDRAVESGGALHVSMGTGSLGGTETMTSLAGAAILDRLADQSATANVPPIVTIADGTLLPLAQDSLRRAFTRRGRQENYDPGQVLMLSPHPEAYAAAAMGVAQDRATAGNVFVGSFGPEVVLLAEAASRTGMPQVAGAAEPLAQALLYPMADYALFGEEVFAASAYLGERGGTGRLVAQDVMRVIVLVIIVVLAVRSLLQG